MRKQITAIIVGAGHRAILYSLYALEHPDELKIVGVADPDPIRRKKVAEMHGFWEEMCFRSAEELAARPKLADAVINGTMDRQHVPTAVPLLRAGYDMLLEKPFAISEEKNKVFRSMLPIQPDEVVRGQYSGYRDEEGIDPDSDTETFIALKCHIDNWRWAGVPFYLRTGKRMARKCSQIVIQFKPVPQRLFDNDQANCLVIRLQPEERISLQLMGKSPGKGMRLTAMELDLNLAQVFPQKRRWDAYERLLLDVIEGDSTLFMRRDEVEAAWAWVDPILDGWQQYYQSPRPYPAGRNGPEQADSLLERSGHQWFEG